MNGTASASQSSYVNGHQNGSAGANGAGSPYEAAENEQATSSASPQNGTLNFLLSFLNTKRVDPSFLQRFERDDGYYTCFDVHDCSCPTHLLFRIIRVQI